MVEFDVSLAVKVEESPGGGDEDMQSLFQLPGLLSLSDASEYSGGSKPESFAERFEVCVDLRGELPCGCEYECLGFPWL